MLMRLSVTDTAVITYNTTMPRLCAAWKPCVMADVASFLTDCRIPARSVQVAASDKPAGHPGPSMGWNLNKTWKVSSRHGGGLGPPRSRSTAEPSQQLRVEQHESVMRLV